MKKLWQRSKSRVRGSQNERSGSTTNASQDATSANTRSSSRAPPAIPPLPQRSSKRDDSTDIPPVPALPPGSSNRIQPMLIGISRPSGTLSRPGTAGSLQHAVDQAANSVARNPQAPNRSTRTSPQKSKAPSRVAQISPPDYTRGHSRTISPRYVDIFAVHNPKSSMSSYNEDVASRNIDVKKVEEDYYAANSRYQEEVASRNAHVHSMSLTDAQYENLPPRPEVLRSPSANEVVYSIPPDRLADADDIRKLHHAQLAALRQPKAFGGSKNAAVPAQVPAKNPSRKSEDSKTRSEAIPVASTNPPSTRSDLRNQRNPPTAQQEVSARSLQPLTTSSLNKIPDISPLAGYQLSRSEFRGRSPPAHPQWAENNDRSGSLLSSASSARRAINLQKRTIMDLTGEDAEALSNGIAESDMSRSPVLEEAHADAYRRGHPELVSYFSNTSGVNRTEQKDGRGTVSQKQIEKATFPVNSNLAPTQRTPETHQPISFSTINTLVSVSPSTRQNGVYSSSTDQSSSAPLNSGTRRQLNKLYTLSETEPEARNIRTQNPAQASTLPPTLFADGPDTPVASSEEKAIATNRVALSTPSQTPQLSSTPGSTPRGIELSPESLQSRDFVEPSRAFGVVTRDFATTPMKSTQAPRSDQEPNTKAKVQHRAPVATVEATPRGEVSVPAVNSRSSLEFDEEGFRLKQEKARAALVRLQQSLNEDFNPPTKAARLMPRIGSKSRGQSAPSNEANDGRPVNSSSIFSQHRDYHGSRPSTNGDIQPRTSSNKQRYTSTQDRPSSSARPRSSASTATVKPIKRHRSPPPQSHRVSQPMSQANENHSGLNEMRRLTDEMRNPRLAPPTMQQTQPSVQKQNGNMNINRFSSSTNSTASTSDVVPSPGELSLSSFPAPGSVQHSRHTSWNLPIQNPADQTPPNSNRNSAQPPPRQSGHVNHENIVPGPSATTSIHVHPVTSSTPHISNNSNSYSIYEQITSLPNPTPTSKSHISNFQRDPPPPARNRAGSSSSVPQSENRPTTSRRGSVHSQTSVKTSSSQYSIPYHLIPDRGSSMRDSLVREVDDEV